VRSRFRGGEHYFDEGIGCAEREAGAEICIHSFPLPKTRKWGTQKPTEGKPQVE